MTDSQNVGSEGGNGASGTPNQNVSTTPSNPIAGDVATLLSSLESKFTSNFDILTKELRGLQGRQDKSDNKVNTFQEKLARLEQYEKQGMTRQEAIAEMEADDKSESRWSSLESRIEQLATLLQNGGTLQNKGQTVTEVFASKGLDVQDPRVAQFLVKQYKSPEEMELAAYRLKDELAKSPNPNPAQNASMQGGQGAISVQAKIERLNALQQDPMRNQKEIKALTAELDAVDWK